MLKSKCGLVRNSNDWCRWSQTNPTDRKQLYHFNRSKYTKASTELVSVLLKDLMDNKLSDIVTETFHPNRTAVLLLSRYQIVGIGIYNGKRVLPLNSKLGAIIYPLLWNITADTWDTILSPSTGTKPEGAGGELKSWYYICCLKILECMAG